MSEHAKNLRLARKMFGDDVIIIHKPEYMDYHIASSTLRPGQSKTVLTDVVNRYDA